MRKIQFTRREPGDAPPLCVGHPLSWEGDVTPCGVTVCKWAFECVNGAVTVEVEADSIVLGESSKLEGDDEN